MDIKSIKTDPDYHAELKEIEALMMAGPDTPEGEKLDVLVTINTGGVAHGSNFDANQHIPIRKDDQKTSGLLRLLR